MKTVEKKKFLRKVVEKAAYKMAALEANTACPFIGYQPQAPKSVKKLRKF